MFLKSYSLLSVAMATGVLLANALSADTDEELESRQRDVRIGYYVAPVVLDSQGNIQRSFSVVVAYSLHRPSVEPKPFKG